MSMPGLVRTPELVYILGFVIYIPPKLILFLIFYFHLIKNAGSWPNISNFNLIIPLVNIVSVIIKIQLRNVKAEVQ